MLCERCIVVFRPIQKDHDPQTNKFFFPNLKLEQNIKAAELKTHTDIPNPDHIQYSPIIGLVLDPGCCKKQGWKNQCPADHYS